jgi:hypothetical protein
MSHGVEGSRSRGAGGPGSVAAQNAVP